MRSLALFAAMSLVACSDDAFPVGAAEDAKAETNDTSIADTTVADTTVPKDSNVVDTATADTAKADTARPDAAGQCVLASDCRKFSSYCATDPCKCLGLKATDPEPICSGPSVTCFIDPCEGKTVECAAGACVVK